MSTPAIVITSIFPPTEAVARFANVPGHRLIVVGDRKSPSGWTCPGAEYLPVDAQVKLPHRLLKALPFNHYCRKMVGYLHAMASGANIIVDTDDDNLPNDGWSYPAFDGRFRVSPDKLGFINIYASFTAQKIWPRGLPLLRINDEKARLDDAQLQVADVKVGVWQGLADGDPDVDAIYRLTNNAPCMFNKAPPLVLSEGTLCPFNSQNTAFRAELFPLLYLPAHVTFRFTDILRGLVAQPIMWAAGYSLGFTEATVFQQRNAHNYQRDFESEIPCYLRVEEVVDVTGAAVTRGADVSSNLQRAYAALQRAGIVTSEELGLLDCWLEDVARLT